MMMMLPSGNDVRQYNRCIYRHRTHGIAKYAFCFLQNKMKKGDPAYTMGDTNNFRSRSRQSILSYLYDGSHCDSASATPSSTPNNRKNKSPKHIKLHRSQQTHSSKTFTISSTRSFPAIALCSATWPTRRTSLRAPALVRQLLRCLPNTKSLENQLLQRSHWYGNVCAETWSLLL